MRGLYEKRLSKVSILNREHFDRFEMAYIIAFWVTTGMLSAWIGAESVIDDHLRTNLSTASWEPYSWEFSSHLISLILIPLVVVLNRRFSLTGTRLKQMLCIHLLISIVYSFLHVIGMVLLREAIYRAMGSQYNFGDWSSELIYEYRKDSYSYAQLLVIIYCYGFIVSRLRGEAKIIATGEDAQESEIAKRLLVKKIGKEFILKTEDIDWVEASGNYMNLHSKRRIYPLRETMAHLEKRLDPVQFVRIHRSTIVNLDQIKQIEPLDSGDYQVLLKDDTQLKLSRRYREKVKGVLL